MNITDKHIEDAGLVPVDMGQRHHDMLSAVYGTVNVCGLEYDAADLLKDCDPVAYRCSFADYVSNEIGETVIEGPDGECYDKDDWDTMVEELEATEEGEV